MQLRLGRRWALIGGLLGLADLAQIRAESLEQPLAVGRVHRLDTSFVLAGDGPEPVAKGKEIAG